MLPFVTFVTFGLYHSRFLCFWGLRCVVHGLSLRSARVPLACARSQSAAEGYRVGMCYIVRGTSTLGAEVYAACSRCSQAPTTRQRATRPFVCSLVRPRQSCNLQRALTSRGHGLLSAARLQGYRVRGWGVRGRFHGTRGGAKGYGSVHGYRGGMVLAGLLVAPKSRQCGTATNRAV